MTRLSPSSESRRNALTVARYLHAHDFTVADVEAFNDVAWAGVLVAAGAGNTYRDLVITKLAALTPPAYCFEGLPGGEAAPPRRCPTCNGNGCEFSCGHCRHAHDGPESHRICRVCAGTGVERGEAA